MTSFAGVNFEKTEIGKPKLLEKYQTVIEFKNAKTSVSNENTTVIKATAKKNNSKAGKNVEWTEKTDDDIKKALMKNARTVSSEFFQIIKKAIKEGFDIADFYSPYNSN